jgi:N-acetyl-1-D-myo-inositol-2-amino-2-deoxy-alpha-D-glucopyranoside deacetylase
MAGTADNDNPASFNRASFDEAVEKVVRVIREEKPQVVVTYDERGGYGHPDHIRAHQIAVAGFAAAGDATKFGSAGSPWAPAKLYYAVVPRSAMLRFGERLRKAGIDVPFARQVEDAERSGEDPPFGVADDLVTTTVDISAYVADKHAALVAHRTQMGPDQFFMRLPAGLFAEVFGRETFQRVAGPGPAAESDLFEGLP